MVMLVKLDQVKARLQYDHDADDVDLKLALQGASEAVMNYLNFTHDHYDDSNGAVVLDDVPAVVKNAIIMLVGIWKRDPSAKEMEKWEQGYLPRPVTSLLYPLRDPVLS